MFSLRGVHARKLTAAVTYFVSRVDGLTSPPRLYQIRISAASVFRSAGGVDEVIHFTTRNIFLSGQAHCFQSPET